MKTVVRNEANRMQSSQAFAEVTMSIFGVGDHRNVLDLERCPIKVDKENTQVKTKFSSKHHPVNISHGNI